MKFICLTSSCVGIHAAASQKYGTALFSMPRPGSDPLLGTSILQPTDDWSSQRSEHHLFTLRPLVDLHPGQHQTHRPNWLQSLAPRFQNGADASKALPCPGVMPCPAIPGRSSIDLHSRTYSSVVSLSNGSSAVSSVQFERGKNRAGKPFGSGSPGLWTLALQPSLLLSPE